MKKPRLSIAGFVGIALAGAMAAAALLAVVFYQATGSIAILLYGGLLSAVSGAGAA